MTGWIPIKNKKNIFITDIRPGLVDTAMAKGEGLFWVMPVRKTVRQIYKAIKRKRKIVYVTKRWSILAVVLKHIPNPAKWYADKFYIR